MRIFLFEALDLFIIKTYKYNYPQTKSWIKKEAPPPSRFSSGLDPSYSANKIQIELLKFCMMYFIEHSE